MLNVVFCIIIPYTGSTKIQATAGVIPVFILRCTSSVDINTDIRASVFSHYNQVGFTVLPDNNYWR